MGAVGLFAATASNTATGFSNARLGQVRFHFRVNFKQQLVNLTRREPNIELLFDVLLKAQALLGKLSVFVVSGHRRSPCAPHHRRQFAQRFHSASVINVEEAGYVKVKILRCKRALFKTADLTEELCSAAMNF